MHAMKTSLKIFPYLVMLLFMAALQGCQHEQRIIMSVRGPLEAGAAGVSLPHEHFLVDFIGADSSGYHRWNRDTVIAKVLPYLLEAKQAGILTIMECTPAYLGRDPLLLQKLSELSGINIVTNTGYYGAIEKRALPPEAFTETADQIAARWINEWQSGIESTQIRPGFIKIAVPGDSLEPVHEKIVRAAARTHLKTGLTINAHTGPEAPAMAELQILEEEGVDPSAFIWTHAQAGSQVSHVSLAAKGAWISLDNVMVDNIESYVSMLSNLKQNNLLHRVLLSHDAGWYDVVDPSSVTYRGYTALFTHLKPALFLAGFTEADWQLLTVTNPQEAYTIRVRKIK
jgi:phosphotriesterase-related protein